MRKILIIIVAIFFIVSCNKNSNGANKNVQKSDDLTKSGTVINTDCVYYDKSYNWRSGGKFFRGQEIEILEGFDSNDYITSIIETDLCVLVEVQTTGGVKGIKGYVNEKYITNANGVNYDLWFKNVILTRDYYYSDEPIKNIFYKDTGLDIDETNPGVDMTMKISHWGGNFGNRIRFSDNYLIGAGEYSWAFRLKEITQKPDAKDGSTYIIKLLSSYGAKLEMTMVDNGNSITITQKSGPGDFLYTYVPYDKEKLEKTAKAVDAWWTEQIGKL